MRCAPPTVGTKAAIVHPRPRMQTPPFFASLNQNQLIWVGGTISPRRPMFLRATHPLSYLLRHSTLKPWRRRRMRRTCGCPAKDSTSCGSVELAGQQRHAVLVLARAKVGLLQIS